MYLNKGSYLVFPMKYDVDKLIESYKSIAQKCEWNQGQISLQHRKGITELNDGIGSIFYDKEVKSDLEFDDFYDIYKDEYITSVLQTLPVNVYRTRIMNIQPKRCYTMHIDKAIRFHIPIDTAENCGRFIFDHGEVLQFEPGNFYILNTKLMHTAINTHPKMSRIHIVGCLEEPNETSSPIMEQIFKDFKI